MAQTLVPMNRELQSSQKALYLHSETKEALCKRLADAIKNVFIRCEECGKKSKLRLWVFIQDHWYIEPRSCAEGDYWKAHPTETCHIRCPKCKGENYIYNHGQKCKIVHLIDSVAKDAGVYKNHLFATVEERHKK